MGGLTTLRVFQCAPYNATLTPGACGARYALMAKPGERRAPGKGLSENHSLCVDCTVGRFHARGNNAPDVEYFERPLDGSAVAPPRRNVIRGGVSHGGKTTALAQAATEAPLRGDRVWPEARDPKPTPLRDDRDRVCEHPGCGETFVAWRHDMRFCAEHRTRKAKQARAKLASATPTREQVDALRHAGLVGVPVVRTIVDPVATVSVDGRQIAEAPARIEYETQSREPARHSIEFQLSHPLIVFEDELVCTRAALLGAYFDTEDECVVVVLHGGVHLSMSKRVTLDAVRAAMAGS